MCYYLHIFAKQFTSFTIEKNKIDRKISKAQLKIHSVSATEKEEYTVSGSLCLISISG